jgi:ATP-dependent Lon protease
MRQTDIQTIFQQLFQSEEDLSLENSSRSESEISEQEMYEDATLPLLPMRNMVLFPGIITPINLSRQKSVKLVKDAYKGEKMVAVLTQANPGEDDPSPEDMYKVGTIARIIKLLVLPDGSTTVIVQGEKRFKLKQIVQDTPYWMAEVTIQHEELFSGEKSQIKALTQSLKETAYRIIKLNPEVPDSQFSFESIEMPWLLVYILCSNINTELGQKQELLEIEDGYQRGIKLLEIMLKEVQVLEIKYEIQSKASSDIDQQQRDYFLRQQMKVLQDELGMEGGERDIAELRRKAEGKQWPEHAKKYFEKELDKASRIHTASPEFAVTINFCEFLVELPWDECTQDNFDLKNAERVLEKEHFGLTKVKQRIIEFLAVLKLKNSMKGPILCLYGPPGVGKTSLGKSIAQALGRKYARISLGGLRDEAELRGHRKTYIGAMPGRILQNIKKVGASNPVFVLDEIDKIGNDFRGDPASALLEILDPEQNNTFTDNYAEIEYDLSRVFFIATANSLDSIHPALRDRMEIIEINGYTQEEKLQIAKQHLLPRLREEHGLKEEHFSIDSKAIAKIISGYTRESGVRNLNQKLSSLVRNIAKSVAIEEPYNKKITSSRVEKILGSPHYLEDDYQENQNAGVVTGLAWTPAGGEILFIEGTLYKGKGRLTLSGQLGEVMKESATAALSFLKVNYRNLSLDYRVFDQYDLHIHIPQGAVPKDGPSAGITLLTAMASAYTQRKVKDRLAMTGEITLRGKVLPVGGIKEKFLAAKRFGIQEIIVCKKNQKDVDEIDQHYLEGLKIHYVDTVEEVIRLALLPEKVKKPIKFELDPLPPFDKQA